MVCLFCDYFWDLDLLVCGSTRDESKISGEVCNECACDMYVWARFHVLCVGILLFGLLSRCLDVFGSDVDLRVSITPSLSLSHPSVV